MASDEIVFIEFIISLFGRTKMSSRIKYIDTAKGLFILMMIFHHLPIRYEGIISDGCSTLEYLKRSNIFFLSFFMPAFFVITGYCSSFIVPFRPFLIRNLKRLLLPGLLFTIIFRFIEVLSIGGGLESWRVFMGPYLIATGSDYWFINSLFWAKLIFWAICNIRLFRTRRALFSIVLFALGVLLKGEGVTIWSYANTLCLVLFLYIGSLLRKFENHEGFRVVNKYAIAISILLPLGALMLGQALPFITRSITVEWNTIPTFLVLSIAGTLSALRLSKCWQKSLFLNYVGRHSIEFYLLHGVFLNNAITFYTSLFGELYTICQSLLFALVVMLFVIMCCSVLSWVLNTRYFKWSLGIF